VVLLSFVTTAPPAEYWREGALYVLRNALLYPATYELPGVFQTVPVSGVVNGVLWTLRLEFTFYLVLMLVRARLSLILVLLGACTAVFIAMTILRPDWAAEQGTRIAFLAARNGLLFFAGAAVQRLDWRIPMWLGIASLPAFPFLGPLALPTAVLGLARPGKLPADLSYGVYIYAFPLQQALAAQGQLNVLTAVLAVVPFAVASWFLVERPALKLKPGPRPAW
jgi:peptidoglycan/LPS O-acetylase OafA/YrhL